MNVFVEKNIAKSLFAISGVVKEFSGVRVLDNINLDVHSGEILGVLGENGAGKSTLLKIISGIYTPTSGNLLFNGEKVDISSPVSRTCASAPSSGSFRPTSLGSFGAAMIVPELS